MPALELEFEVFCGRCGAGLCNNTREGKTRHRQQPCINVDPCEKCLEAENEAGFDKGYKQSENERAN